MSDRGLGKVYRDGEEIVRQNEVGDCMFVIQEGQVEVLSELDDDEFRLGLLGPGEFFGEMAIVEKQARAATVRAVGEARVLTVDKRTFLRRVQEDPTLALNILRTLCQRIRALDTEIAELRDELSEGPP
jgi:CRP-like cAMP-binding protein